MIDLTRVKDLLTGRAARAAIQRRLKPIGKMLNLAIDSKKKTIRAEIHLKGEESSVTVHVGRYELIEESGRTFLQLDSVDASREWMRLLFEELTREKRIEIPSLLKAAL